MNLYMISALRGDQIFVVASSIDDALEKFRKSTDCGEVSKIILLDSRVIV